MDDWKLDVPRSYQVALLSVNTCMFVPSLQLTWLRKAGWRVKIHERTWVGLLWATGAGWEVYGYADLSVGQHGWAEGFCEKQWPRSHRFKMAWAKYSICFTPYMWGEGRFKVTFSIYASLIHYRCTFYNLRHDERCIYQICKATSELIGFVGFSLCFRI